MPRKSIRASGLFCQPASVDDDNVVFIQGGGAGAHDEDAALVASLRRELGDGIRVDYPAMPDEGEPDAADAGVPRSRAAIGEADVVVGHSIGGYLLLAQLAIELPGELRASA